MACNAVMLTAELFKVRLIKLTCPVDLHLNNFKVHKTAKTFVQTFVSINKLSKGKAMIRNLIL